MITERMNGESIAMCFSGGKDSAMALSEIVRARTYLVCVNPAALDASFAGRAFDAALLADLPRGVDPCGENGEFHSFVFDGPIFRRPVAVAHGPVVERDDFVFADLVPRQGARAAPGAGAGGSP